MQKRSTPGFFINGFGISFVFLLLLNGLAVGADFIFSQESKAKATIVIADQHHYTHMPNLKARSSERVYISVKDWANELAKRLKEATNADFPILPASQAPETGLLILVGTSQLSKQYGFDGAANMRPEEARVATFSRGVALYGELIDANAYGARPLLIRELKSAKPHNTSSRGNSHRPWHWTCCYLVFRGVCRI